MAVENAALPMAAPGERVESESRTRTGAWAPPAVAAIVLLTLIGAVFRVIVANQSLFADELSTYWISATHGLGGVLSLLYSSGRIQHAEITPPLSFLASWLTTRPGTSPELLRLPALVSGIATIPVVYVLGLRTVGRRAALLATAVTALSPFMIYYSAEARAYGLLMLLVCCSTLSMLLALDTGRRRYWVLYAVFSAAAFYTHYTCLFVLAVQLAWLLWARPQVRRPALLANAAAAALVIPWIPGLIADLRSPTVKILSAISAFTPYAVRIDLQHWAIGYPYTMAGGLTGLPGAPALVLLAGAVALATAGVVLAVARGRGAEALRRIAPARGGDAGWPRITLVALLMVATPIGEIVVSAFGNHIIGIRDMGASWPFLALTASAVVIASGPRLGLAAAALTVVAFALAAPKMLEPRFSRPDYRSAANYVAAHASLGDVAIDGTGVLSPGPLTGFDVAFHRRLPVFRALTRSERDHPFTLLDPVESIQQAFARAVRTANGRRIFIVSSLANGTFGSPNPLTPPVLPGGYRRELQRQYPGFLLTLVSVYARPAAGTA